MAGTGKGRPIGGMVTIASRMPAGIGSFYTDEQSMGRRTALPVCKITCPLHVNLPA
jgi:hypothetical protein